MVKKKENILNETLNNLLLKIFGGVNYASKLALETGKSIPVVFKQLDELVRTNILEKTRSGKKVEYIVNWSKISDIMSDIAEKEVSQVLGIMKRSKDKTGELYSLAKEFSNMNKIKQNVSHILQMVPVQKSLTALSQELEKAKSISQKYSKLDFKDNLLYFLDSLAMLDEKQRKNFLSKFSKLEQKSVDEFLKLCRLHYLLGEINDPRKIFTNRFFK